jgi:hypothetical protein
VTVTEFLIFGSPAARPGYGPATDLIAQAVNLAPHPTWQGSCTGNEPPANTTQILLPGQSLTTYINGTWSYLGSPINSFQGQVIYELQGSSLSYSIDNNISWIQ